MNNVTRPVVGIDVSKKKLDVALLADGKSKSKVVENSSKGFGELTEWLRKQKVVVEGVHACMEATGIYSEPIALALLALGMTVSVVNPNRIKSFGQSENVRNKNDSVDAGVIARYCAAMHPEPWLAPSQEQRQLRALSDRLLALKDIRQQELNRIEVHEFANHQSLVINVREHVTWLDEQIARLEKDIDHHIDQHPGLKQDVDLITSIPGLGPRQRTSGSSVRGRTMISRMGSGQLRAALFMPSLVARRFNPLLNAFAERLLKTGMPKMAVTGAVMRKLVHQIYGVIRSGKPFNPLILQKGLASQDGI